MRKKEIRPLSPEDQEYVRNFLQINDPLIRRVVARYMHPNTPAEFEDLLQNTYEAICRQLDVFKTCENPEPLLRTIAMRQVWATNRKHRPTVPLLDTVSAPTEDRGLDEFYPPPLPPLIGSCSRPSMYAGKPWWSWPPKRAASPPQCTSGPNGPGTT